MGGVSAALTQRSSPSEREKPAGLERGEGTVSHGLSVSLHGYLVTVEAFSLRFFFLPLNKKCEGALDLNTMDLIFSFEIFLAEID